jgi:hypothetical protein
MKNIHILPTNNPSRIYLVNSNNSLGITSNNPEFTENFGSGTQNQNIYITSDEEIKEEDEGWCYTTGSHFTNSGKGRITKEVINQNGKNGLIFLKIILTTDSDLINDGVQAIDDEFLEWFVKNPSCEGVEYDKNYNRINGKYYYKIIIPQEKPIVIRGGDEIVFPSSTIITFKPKNETIEEARKYAELSYYGDEVDAFVDGTNWQKEQYTLEEQHIGHTIDELSKEYIKGFNEGSARQKERMYSEEEVLEIFDTFKMYLPFHYEFLVKDQFKKK